MLWNKDFLKQLVHHPNQTKYVRLIALDKDERPIETIEGHATGGSISIDGTSKKQRTCSGISLIGHDLTINDVNWALKSRFKIEIGLENKIDPNYPSIIWFKQGTYGVNSFSASQSTSGITVNIGGQDKLGYLDGTFGGIIPMQVNFGVEDFIQPNGRVVSTPIPLYKIIREAVHAYGGEPYHNIIINDLDEYGYELWEYRGGSSDSEIDIKSPIYYFYKDNQVENMTFNENMTVYRSNGNQISLKDLDENDLYIQNTGFSTGQNFSLTAGEEPRYKIAKLEYGDVAGYHRTALTYAGELILNAGETITSLLDKIVSMLGEFEYFYNLDGQFVFQKKKNYVQEILTPKNGETFDPVVQLNKYSYEFNDQSLLTNVSRSPNIKDVKNDFIIWGNRKNATGADLPIHLRVAVKKKPSYYVVPKDYYERYFLYGIEAIQASELPSGYDWYVKDSNNNYIIATKEDINNKQDLYYIKESYNKTGYYYQKKDNNYYYVDISKITLYQKNTRTNEFVKYKFNESTQIASELFAVVEKAGTAYGSFDYYNDPNANKSGITKWYDWRELIYIMARDYYQHNEELDFEHKLSISNSWAKNGKTGYEPFYADIQGFWRTLYYPNWKKEESDGVNEFLTYGDYQWWNRNSVYSPSSLIFWFDFIEPFGDLEQYSIEEMGIRTKVENKNDITSLFYEKVPEVQFIINPTETQDQSYDYTTMAYQPMWIQDSIRELFTISGRGLSATEQLDNLIYNHLCCAESVNLNCIPIYSLEPNTRIYIKDNELGIHGDYLLSKITIPLSYNGTMSLTTNKVIQNLSRTYFTKAISHNAPNLLLVDANNYYLTDNKNVFLCVGGAFNA